MEIRHLRAFCAVAEEMHVTRAAKRLRVAQPALTQQIRLLENALGFRLLQRTGRGVTLTEPGAFFHKEVAAVLDQLHNASLKAQEIARGEAGHIHVGTTEGAAFNPTLAAVFNRFRARWPAVALTFSQKQTMELVRDLRAGLIDAAVICPVAPIEDLSMTELYRARMLLAVPSGHRHAGDTSLPLRALEGEPVVLVSHGQTLDSLESTLTEACKRLRFSPRIAQTTSDFMLALNLVASGAGCAFVPAYMSSIHPEAIRYLQVETPLPIEMHIVFATRADQTSPSVCNLRSLAVRAFQSEGSELPIKAVKAGLGRPTKANGHVHRELSAASKR